jgi:DNA-binding beta-propeller fold protein YncE
VFVTDSEGNRIHKYTSLGAFITSWATAQLPADVAVNADGDVFVVTLLGKLVQKFTSGGTFLANIGSPGGGPGQFQDPVGIAVDAGGRIYVADGGRVRVLRFLANGTFDMEFAVPAPPSDMAVGPDGNIYVVRSDFNFVHQFSPDGTLLQTFQGPDGLSLAFRIAISPTGVIYIVEQNNNRVTMFQINQVTSAARTTFGRLKAMYR